MKGLVVEEHRDRIVFSTEQGEQTIWRSDIDEVFYDDPERNYFYLGNQAAENGNFPLAKGFFRKSLQIYPQFEEADNALHRLEDLEKKSAALPSKSSPIEALEREWGFTLGLVSGEPQDRSHDRGGGSGAASSSRSQRPLVKKVEAGSLAERSGIQPGDLLVSAWGESLSFLPLTEVAKALLGPAGSTVKLTIERRVALKAASSGDTKWPGLTLGMERLGLAGIAIQPRGSAEAEGIQWLDRIVAMDGKSTRYLPLEAARRQLQEAKGRGMLLSVQRDLMVKRE